MLTGPKIVELEILYNLENRTCRVSGPITDRLLCDGILKAAERQIDEWHRTKRNGIAQASAADLRHIEELPVAQNVVNN